MKTTLTQRKFAVITGVSLVVMTIAAGMVMGTVFVPLFEMDIVQLEAVLPSMNNAFLLGIVGWIVILTCDLAVTWGLYHYFKPVNDRKAKITGGLRLIYSLILLVAIIKLVHAWLLIYTTSTDAAGFYSLLYDFQAIWQFGLIIFGLHLLTLAPLVCKKRSIRQAISMLLFLAGIGYVLSNTADLFIADYEQYRANVEMVFILPMVLGEFGLSIWLLVKGGKAVTCPETQFASGSC